MKSSKIRKIISIIACIIGLLVALYFLINGINSLGSTDLAGIGIIFVLPSVIAIIILLLDFIISICKTKKGLIFSYLSSIIKVGLILLFIPSIIDDLKYRNSFGYSNLDFDLIIITVIIIITIQSILNIIKIKKEKKESK